MITRAGFRLIAIYPVASEGTRSGNLVFHTNRRSVAYDIIHVCAKRHGRDATFSANWAVARSDLARNLRERVDGLLAGVDHGQRVYPADVAIMAWADVMKLYSASADAIVAPTGDPLPLSEALDDLEPIVRDTASYAVERMGESASVHAVATS